MLGIKKKMAAFLPGENVREALQNVLTVEWSGHKTVLVEVPNSGSSRSNEVEMSGMNDTASGIGYGQLVDDEEDDRAFLNQSRSYFDQPRKQVDLHHDRPPPLPPKPAYDSRSSSYNSHNSYTASSGRVQQAYGNGNGNGAWASANPFRSVDDGDYSPTPSIAELRPQISRSRRLDTDLFAFEQEHGERGWSATPTSSKANPWAGRNWGTGNGEGQTSPVSSTGTRFSPTPSAEDPFKN